MMHERASSSPRMAVEEVHDDVHRRGRRVVATIALQPGDAIYAAPPDIAVLYSPFARHICARCFVAEVAANEKGEHTLQQKREGKMRLQSGNARRRKTSLTATASSACAATEATALASTPSKEIGPHAAHVCPYCDQFVLCALCVGQLLQEVELMAATAAKEAKGATENSTTTKTAEERKRLLLEHPMLRAHAIACAWYTSLPESIRAPGNDTDFLRFCLDYGARVVLGDTAMVAAVKKLDTNAMVQSKEAHHLCEVFARDRVVATFGPRKPATTTTTAAATTTASAVIPAFASALDCKEDAELPSATLLKTTTVRKTDRSGSSADQIAFRTVSGASLQDVRLHPPPYPVPWTELRDVLLRTRCNSLGFPFSASETIGWSLQETVCMLNHSCVPNAAVVMLYDAEDAQRLHHIHSSENKTQGETARSEKETKTRAEDSHRRERRSSGASTHGRGTSATSSSKIKNLNSYCAVAVSAPSSFSTFFSEHLQGWIGIQAIRPIAAGEEITVSYVDVEMFGNDVQARSRHLLEQYRFLCTCELCTRQRGRKL